MTRPAAITDPPRVLFFGPPRSGKSTLLDQVMRVATAAAGSAAASVTAADPGTGFREVIPHRVVVSNPTAGPLGGQFELCDCDGQKSSELLAHPDAAVRAKAQSLLGGAVRTADALVLAVDAAASPADVEETFRQFRQLLGVLTAERAEGREVGGWPVFLTLTKCDTLALDGEGPAGWLRRVEARKAELRDHFAEFFADDLDAPGDDTDLAYHRFGSLALNLAATSLHVPPGALFDIYADPAGGFGVYDLAGECLAAAREQHDRVAASRRRLRATVLGVGGLLAALLVAVTLLATSGFLSATDRLAERVRAYRAGEPPAATRLAERRLARHVKELRSLREADGYDELPADLREFVEGRVREAEDYKAYRARFQPPRLGPAELRTRDQADALAGDLRGDLAPPAAYRPAWDDTECVKLWAKWRRDLELVTAAESQLHEWYRGLIRRANDLLLTPAPPDGPWRAGVAALVADAGRSPFDPKADVPGSPAVPVPRGRKLTFDAAGRFDRVGLARRDWDDTRDRLRCLADLADALGMTGRPDAPLDLPEPAPGVASRDLGTARLAALAAAFPPRRALDQGLAKTAFPEWFEHVYPEAARRAVEARIALSRETALRHFRAVVKEDAGGESPENLRRLVAGTPRPLPLADWDRLARALTKFETRKTNTPTPLDELAAFVSVDRYAAEVPALELRLPDDLLEQRARPAGPLTLTVGAKAYPYAVAGEPQRDNGMATYRFTAAGHDGRVTLTPGDAVTAALTLAGGEEARLAWKSPRAESYRFDAFDAVPTLSRGAAGTASAAGVRLVVPSPGKWPRLPDLLRAAPRR